MKSRPSANHRVAHLQPGFEYRALTLDPEFAWAIFHAGKDVENRNWPTSHRGALLIHASALTRAPGDLLEHRRALANRSGMQLREIPEQFEGRALLGMVDVVDCVEGSDSPWAGDTRYQWLLANARPFAEPLKIARGSQKIWLWRAPIDSHATPSNTPAVPASAQEPKDVDRLDGDVVLAAFAAMATREPANDVDLYRAVSRKLGFTRMGSRVEAALRSHARRAVRMGVLVRDGKRLQAAR